MLTRLPAQFWFAFFAAAILALAFARPLETVPMTLLQLTAIVSWIMGCAMMVRAGGKDDNGSSE